MKGIFNEIWELAKPYYEEGRVYDIKQVTWMLERAEEICKNLEVNEDILIPLIILHDVGYSVVSDKNPHIKDARIKRIHMKAGAEIAAGILKKVDYDKELSEKIINYVSVHDNWVFGDDSPFNESLEMALFNDLDFLYAQADFESLKLQGESMGLSPRETYEFWLKDEKLVRRPFCCRETEELFKNLMAERKKEIYA